MAIPGLAPKHEVRAKVRIGEKRKTEKGKEYPAALDHFVCDDEVFYQTFGPKPSHLTILLPYAEPELNFSTGLEQWAGQMLVCYAKGETESGKPVAWRKQTMKKGGQEVNLLDGFERLTDRTIGQDRAGVHCRSRECPILKQKDGCKPMGRLQFFLPGVSPSQGVYQLDTKSWHTIEQIEGLLSVLGDPRGRPLTLKVEMRQKGRDRFPVITLEAPDVDVNTLADADKADALIGLRKAYDAFHHAGGDAEGDETKLKLAICATLDVTTPKWREMPDLIQRLKDIGPDEAAHGMLERFQA